MNYSTIEIGDFDEHFVGTYEGFAEKLIPATGPSETTRGEALRIASLLYNHVRTDDYHRMTLLHLSGWLQEWMAANGAPLSLMDSADLVCKTLAESCIETEEFTDDSPAGLDFDNGFKNLDYATAIERIICWVTDRVAALERAKYRGIIPK